jgi:hypothetical protein
MIEIGEETTSQMTHDEAVMYCFCLGDGWRLPTYDEYIDTPAIGWYDDDVWKHKAEKYYVTPVRDLKDD